MIPYGRQNIDDADIQAVINVLRSDFLTQGPAVPAFEQKIAEYCDAKHGVAVNSATSALHIACLALDVGPGDVVWTSPISFVASANCARYCGASVDFVDIDPRTYNMSVERLASKLQTAKVQGNLPKVVIPVHLCGQSCEMEEIHILSQEYGFKIIEDASHAIGGRYKGELVGNCRYSDITVFSFHPVKIITTGEGGVALCNNEALANRMALLRSHGVTRAPEQMICDPDGAWIYEQIDLGFNYRMTDMQAALGASQMDRLDSFIARRHELAERYDAALKDLPLTLPFQHHNSHSAYHLYVIGLKQDGVSIDRKTLFDQLRAAGIGVNVHYIPVHTQPYYKGFGFKNGDFLVAETYYDSAISLPIYPAMTDEQQDRVISVLRRLVVK